MNNDENISETEENPQENDFNSSEFDEIAGLNEVGGEQKISVNRMRPFWAKGWIETVPIEHFSMEYLKESHGGGSYELRKLNEFGRYKGQKTVDVAGLPKRDGVDMESPEQISRRERMEEQNRLFSAPRQNNNDSKMLEILMSQLSDSQKNNVELLLKLMKPAKQTGLSDIQEMFTFVESIKSGQPLDGETKEDGDSTQSMILELVKMFQNKQTETPQNIGADYLRNVKPPVSTPRQRPQRPQERSPVQATPQPHPVQRAVQPAKEAVEDEPADLVEAIAGLDPKDAVEVFADVLSKYPKDKRLELFQIFSENESLFSDILEETDNEPGEPVANRSANSPE